MDVESNKKSKNTYAAVLSIVPGLGQIVTGRFLAGVIWFFVTLLGYLTFFLPGIILHVICIRSAYSMSTFQKNPDKR